MILIRSKQQYTLSVRKHLQSECCIGTDLPAFQNSVSFSRSLSPGELGLSGKKSNHFRLPLSGALLYYHTAHPRVNTFFTLFFAFFRLFFKSETSAFLPDGTFGFRSRCCVFSCFIPQISVFLLSALFAEYKKKTVSTRKQ